MNVCFECNSSVFTYGWVICACWHCGCHFYCASQSAAPPLAVSWSQSSSLPVVLIRNVTLARQSGSHLSSSIDSKHHLPSVRRCNKRAKKTAKADTIPDYLPLCCVYTVFHKYWSYSGFWWNNVIF